MAVHHILIFVFLVLGSLCLSCVADGIPDLEICDPQDIKSRADKQTTPLPKLPDQFTARVECNLLNRNTTIDIHEYYDGTNDRGTLHMYDDGTRIHMLFDYPTDELLTIVDDDDGAPDCTVTKVSTSAFQYLFGLNLFKKNGTERISSPQIAFKFGGAIPEAYLGKQVIRGINVDVWESCIFWDKAQATMHVTYYFSGADWSNSLASVQPVRAHVVGSSRNATTTRKWEHIYEFTDFFDSIRGDPAKIFETPHHAYCPNRQSTTAIPTISDAFSFSAEILDLNTNTMNNIKEYYDFNMHLFRYDYFPNPSGPTPYGINKLVRIHDFNTGVAYIIDSVMGNCSTTPIIADGLDAEKTGNGNVRIRTKEEFFDLANVNYQYVGQKVVRGILCDVFTAARTDWPPETNMATTWEWSFASSEWVESVGTLYEFGLPISFSVISYDTPFNNLYNVYNYKEDRPMIWTFDITPCYSIDNRKDVQFALPGSFRHVVEPNEMLFKEFVLISISGYVALSPLRVTNIMYSYTTNEIIVSFTILDVAPVGDVQHIKEITLDEADQLLAKLINNGDFIVRMDNDTFADLQVLIAKPYSYVSTDIYLNGKAFPSTSSGYSAGAMAGLGIAMLIVAFALGLGILFFILKIKSGGFPDGITHTFTSGFSPKRFEDTEMKADEEAK